MWEANQSLKSNIQTDPKRVVLSTVTVQGPVASALGQAGAFHTGFMDVVFGLFVSHESFYDFDSGAGFVYRCVRSRQGTAALAKWHPGSQGRLTTGHPNTDAVPRPGR